MHGMVLAIPLSTLCVSIANAARAALIRAGSTRLQAVYSLWPSILLCVFCPHLHVFCVSCLDGCVQGVTNCTSQGAACVCTVFLPFKQNPDNRVTGWASFCYSCSVDSEGPQCDHLCVVSDPLYACAGYGVISRGRRWSTPVEVMLPILWAVEVGLECGMV